jgi:uncharacterized membrane protein YoaK (UPF0700 family)
MQVVRAVIGAVFLFLGRELNFFFAAAMAALIGLRLTPRLPPQWPAWSDYAFMLGLAVLAAVVSIRNERAGYFLSGFLVGAYCLVEYYEPGILTLPLLPFVVGGVIGSLVIGIFTKWALMIISCLVGAYFLTGLFNLSPTADLLVGGGLFIIGALTQVVLMQMQKGGDEEI